MTATRGWRLIVDGFGAGAMAPNSYLVDYDDAAPHRVSCLIVPCRNNTNKFARRGLASVGVRVE